MTETAPFTLVFLGDVVGKAGRRAVAAELPGLRAAYSPAMVIANGENAAGGLGIDPGTADEIFSAGVDVITTGNHVWSKKDLVPYLDLHADKIVRPANYSPGAPGRGGLIWKSPCGATVAVVNVMGRVFLSELLDCPFRTVDLVLSTEAAGADYTVVDMHAEATSEKLAMAYHLDGRATLVAGTHTHVQTADERLLPNGTAYISDVGMCGPYDSVLGVKPEAIIERFMTGRPIRFDLAKGPSVLNAVVVKCSRTTRKAQSIERIKRVIGE